MFGQQQNQQTNSFGGGGTGGGGLFGGGAAQTPLGGGGLFGKPAAGSGFGGGGTGSMFGAGGQSTFGGQQQQNTGGGLFGQSSQGGFGQSNSGQSTGFGGQQQSTFGQGQGFANQGANNSGGGGGLFGKPQQSTFGQQNQNQPSLFGQQNNNAGSSFGQSNTGGFGGQSQGGMQQQTLNFGQQQNQQRTGFGSFSQSSSTFGGQGQQQQNSGFGGFGQQNPGFGNQMGNQQQQQKQASFYNVNYEQQLFSVQYNFQDIKKEQNEQGKTQAVKNLLFKTIKGDPKFEPVSLDMIRLADIMGKKKGQPQQSWEFLGKQEFQNNMNNYNLVQDLQKLCQENNIGPSNASPGTGTQGGGLFGNNQQNAPNSGFGGLNQQQNNSGGGLFGQQQNNQNQGGTFGNQSQSTGGLFGQNNNQQNNAFGNQGNTAGGFFGNNAQSNTLNKQGSLFGNAQPQQNTSQFNQAQPGSSLFGSTANPQQTTGGGLFGNPATQQPQGHSLFGAATQNNNASAGGLFKSAGNQQNSQSTSIFGQTQQPQNQQQPGGGGLFGQQPQQPQAQAQGNSLFGNAQPQNQAQPSTSLFGNNQAQAQNQQTGGLFGNKPAPSAGTGGGSLFGNTSQPATGTTSLFGNPQQQNQQPGQASTGGLFGSANQAQSKPAAGTSLFGNPQNSSLQTSSTGQQVQGGLFGAKPANPGTGLFGNTAQPGAQPNSLFGSTASQHKPAGSLFGSAQPSQPTSLFGPSTGQPQGQGLLGNAQAQTQSSASAQPSGLFAATPQQASQMAMNQGQAQDLQHVYQNFRNDPFGLQTNAATNEEQLFEQELRALKEECSRMASSSNGGVPVSQNNRTVVQISLNPQGGAEIMTGVHNHNLLQQNFEANMFQNMGSTYGGMNYFEQEEMRRREKEAVKFRNSNVAFPGTVGSQMRHSTANGTNVFTSQPQRQTQISFLQNNHQNQSELIQNHHKELQESKTQIKEVGCSSTAEDLRGEHLMDPNILDIAVVLNHDEKEYSVAMQFHKTRDAKDLYHKVLLWLKNECGKSDLVSSTNDFRITYRNRIVNYNNSLNEEQITHSDCKVFVLLDDFKKPKEAEVHKQSHVQQNKENKASVQMVPNIRSPNISMEQIRDMTEDELKQVKDFTVERPGVGLIVFLGRCDLTQVNLADSVEIENGFVEVYSEEYEAKYGKPEQGTKLNMPAMIELKQIKPKKALNESQANEYYRKMLQKRGAEHISYGLDSMVWTFKVPHFTKWGDSESDEEMQDNHAQNQKVSQNVSKSNFQDGTLYHSIQKSSPQKKQDFNKADDEPSNIFESSKFYSLTNNNKTQSKLFQSKGQSKPQVPKFKVGDPLPKKDLLNESVISQASSKRLKLAEPIQELGSSKINHIQEIMSRRQKQKLMILDRIRDKEKQIDKQTQLFQARYSDKETTDYLNKNMKVKSIKTLTSMRGIRPLWKPDGSGIVTVSTQQKDQGNNVSSFKVTNVKSEQNKASDRVKDEFEILQRFYVGGVSQEEIGLQMNNLSLQQSQIRNRQSACLLNSDQKVTNDVFIERMIQGSNLSISGQYVKSQHDHCLFISDFAKAFFQAKDKLNDFYQMCMLNIVYGDYKNHLHQMSEKFHQQRLNNTQTQHLQLEFKSFETEKQKKNSLVELLKFMCKHLFPAKACKQLGATNDQIYARCFDLLLNGDIMEAVSHLNSHNKHKFAMIVAQCTTSIPQNVLDGNIVRNNNLKQIIQLMSGNLQISEAINWQQALLAHLLYKKNTYKQTLSDAVEDFHQQVYQQVYRHRVQDLTYLTLRTYTLLNKSNKGQQQYINEISTLEEQLNTFYGINSEMTDLRIQWITQFVIRNYERLLIQKLGHLSNHRSSLLVSESSYYQQLMGYMHCSMLQNWQDGWKQAMMLCFYMPQSYEAIAKKVLFDLVQQNLLKILSQDQANLQFLQTKLLVPSQWLMVVKAQALLTLHDYESAMRLLIEAKDFQQAHEILITHIAPLYFLQGSSKVSHMTTQKQLESLQMQVNRLDRFFDKIPDWRHGGKLLKNVLDKQCLQVKQGSCEGDATAIVFNECEIKQMWSDIDDVKTHPLVKQFVAQFLYSHQIEIVKHKIDQSQGQKGQLQLQLQYSVINRSMIESIVDQEVSSLSYLKDKESKRKQAIETIEHHVMVKKHFQ